MTNPEGTWAASGIFSNANRLMDAYGVVLQPLCEETGMPRMALEILLFLANNPDFDTAKDICRCRGFKPGIVSFHVDKLVEGGLLSRESIPGDRRKTRLVPTEAAGELIVHGRALQKRFALKLVEGLSHDDLEHFRHCLEVFDQNIHRIRSEGV